MSWKDEKKREEQINADQVLPLDELEKALDSELNDLQKAFRDRSERESKRFIDVCDTNYYFTVCFQTREQMEEFCEKVGLDPLDKYHDGRTFARCIGKALESPDIDFPKTQPINKSWKERAMKK